jgi:hypothetical protein
LAEQALFEKSLEESLWRETLDLDSTLDSYYKQLKDLGDSDDKLEEKRKDALTLSRDIVTNIGADVAKARTRLLGGQIGTEYVRGFLELWRNQALREADMGWDNQRLVKIYNLLESKFTRALLTQLRCVRLLMEAQQTLFTEGKSKTDAIDYYSKEFFPLLRQEVIGFRDAVVTLMGPQFGDKPVKVFDDFDEDVEITKPGDYELRGAYQLNVRTPNESLGGRPITVEMQAKLTPAG